MMSRMCVQSGMQCENDVRDWGAIVVGMVFRALNSSADGALTTHLYMCKDLGVCRACSSSVVSALLTHATKIISPATGISALQVNR